MEVLPAAKPMFVRLARRLPIPPALAVSDSDALTPYMSHVVPGCAFWLLTVTDRFVRTSSPPMSTVPGAVQPLCAPRLANFVSPSESIMLTKCPSFPPPIVEVDVQHAGHALATERQVLPAIGEHRELLPAVLVRRVFAVLRHDEVRVRAHPVFEQRIDRVRFPVEILDVRARRQEPVRDDLRELLRGRRPIPARAALWDRREPRRHDAVAAHVVEGRRTARDLRRVDHEALELGCPERRELGVGLVVRRHPGARRRRAPDE